MWEKNNNCYFSKSAFSNVSKSCKCLDSVYGLLIFMATDMFTERKVLAAIISVAIRSQTQMMDSFQEKDFFTGLFCLIVVAYQVYGFYWIVSWLIRLLFCKAVQDEDEDDY